MHMYIKVLFLSILLLGFFIISNLSGFVPLRANFVNDYQHQLYISWMERSGFSPHSPASISHTLIRITYNTDFNRKLLIECDLQDSRIIALREIVPQQMFRSDYPAEEREYRRYLEMILYRLNSDQGFFLTDLLTYFDIVITLNGEELTPADTLHLAFSEDRFYPDEIQFSVIDSSHFKYRLKMLSGDEFEILLPSEANLANLLPALNRRENYSADIERLKGERGAGNYETSQSHYYYSTPSPSGQRYSTSTFRFVSKIPDRNLPLRDYVDTYREHIWGREMLYNKINNPTQFLTAEFPHHRLIQSANSFELKTTPFNDHLLADIRLLKKTFRDGIGFEAWEESQIDQNKTLELSTGDRIKLSELNDEEIEIITPYLSQLITMHRVMGTKLLNFLLIPADVPTILVLRDPERWISEFTSYTDLILMLSHYWEKRTVYFSIEQVKKVNNYIELHGFLVALQQDSADFDFAEVRFALDRYYRIDLAMMSLYTNITLNEEFITP